jgi:hypothetical protein
MLKINTENQLMVRSITKLLVAILFILGLVGLQGCTGVFTGHEYSKKDFVIVYKVVKNGVTTFMTPEEIEAAKLDKVDIVVSDSYKLLNPEELEIYRENSNEKQSDSIPTIK